MAYMDFKQYEQVMRSIECTESQAVKLHLGKAIESNRIKNNLIKSSQDFPSDVIKSEIKKYEQKRVEAVWEAIWTAEQEKKQNWRFIEDLNDHLIVLRCKYGDETKCNEDEKKELEVAGLYRKWNLKTER